MSQNSLYFYKKSGLQENNEILGFGGITLRSDNWRGTFHNQRKYDQMNVSNLQNCDYSILKSDNIIFREEIAKLAEINKHYEDELKLQRNKK